MTLSRYTQTDEQEESIAKVEKIAKKLKFNLRYGTSIGKSPQTVILDHGYQDGLVRIDSDADITINGEDTPNSSQIIKAFKEIQNGN